jgi:probable blue pigment (indigoidine) exporter
LFAWLLLSERPHLSALIGVGVGFAGVCLMVLSGTGSIDPFGLLASLAAMTMSSAGYILAKKWNSQVDVISSTTWQLIGGALVLLPVAAVTEGGPPDLAGPALLGFAYVSIVATALAFVAWFTGLRHLPASTVGLIGLLNPVTGVLLGHLLATETLGARQVVGLALVLIGVVVGRRRGTTATPRPGARDRERTPAGTPRRIPHPNPRASCTGSVHRTS